jgi:signal peptidase I
MTATVAGEADGAPKTERKSWRRRLFEAAMMGGGGLFVLLVAARVLLYQPYTIPSASEEPTLLRGDYVIVSTWNYVPRRGDIVVFKLPRDGRTDYIKRLVGMPGDRIQMKNGTLWINDKPVGEQSLGTHTVSDRGTAEPVTWIRETNPEGRSYTIQDHGRGYAADDTGVYVVPQHCYFTLGDNRDNSADSRFDPGLPPGDPRLGGCGWDVKNDAQLSDIGVGFVPARNMVGRASLILASWDTGLMEGDGGGASVFKPWTWFTKARTERFFRGL